jgi:hypothetical protein
MKNSLRLLFVALTLSMVACASTPVTRVSVQSFEIKKEGITPQAAVSKVIGVLVDQGFDVKMSNADAGIVTTEYKKFASLGTRPPFDFYMQIRAKVRVADGVTSIGLIPALKEQNRQNTAAFTERELVYFTGEPENIEEIESMHPSSGWRSLAQLMFMNVVNETAETFGIRAEDVIQNVSKTMADAGDEEN